MNKKFFTLLMCCFVLTGAFAQQTATQLTERLVKKLQTSQPNDYLQVIILMKEQANTEALSQRLYAINASPSQRSQEVINLLKTTAESSQKELLADLRNATAHGDVKFFDAYWISNLVVASVKRDYLYDLQNRTDLMTIDLDGILKLDAITKSDKVAKAQANSSEAGACIINAKPLWQMGYTGCGRTVMNIDTGVDGTHPALSTRWKGNFVPSSQAWLDQMTSPFTTTPTDCDGHGTHTMGIMTGLDAANNDTLGIAFGAQWMASQTICSSPHTSYSIAAFQWAMNPDNNASTTTDRPDVINCSWYDPDVTACDATYQTTLTNVEAAGIAVVFSAGNSGPGVGTITNPKSINATLTNTFTVANVDAQVCGGTYTIASSSSRGPSACGGTGSLNIKPEVSAPGTSVRSTYVGGGYAYLTGTSMAAPHVAGAIALLKEAFPNHTGEQIKLALYNTCTDLGTAGEDNNYGMGMINVYAAFQYLQANAGSTFYQPLAPCDMRCGGLTELIGCTGTFSDGSGTFLYPNYSNCKWSISTPTGTAPTLTFSAFDIESGYDFVYVYDGPDSLSPLLGSFTGATIPPAITASGNSMFVKFTSDYIVRDNGFTASYTAAPVPVITGPSSTCYGTAGVLNVSSPGCSGCSYSWNLSPANTTQTQLVTSTANYTATVTNSCGTTVTSPFAFTINKLPSAKAGVDKTACQGTATSIGSTATTGISYVWSPTTGLSNPSISNPSATPTSTTTYIVTAINNTTGCYQKDTMILTVNPVPSVNAGLDKSVCAGGCTTIGSGTASSGATYTWSPTVPLPNTIVNTVCPTATTTYTLTGTYPTTGCTKSDQVKVTVNPKPTANAGTDKVLCAGSTASIGSTAVSGVSYSWSSSSGLSSVSVANPVYTAPSVTATTTYTYYVTAYFSATGCYTRDTVLLTVNPKPTANAGADKSICSGANTTIGATAVAGINYAWTPTTALSSSTVSNPTANPTSTTTYTVTATNSTTGCTATDAMILTVNPLPVANAGVDQTICSGSSISIGSAAVSGVTYTWSPTTALGTPYASTTTAAPTTTTTYTVTAKITATGCSSTDQVIVTVNAKPTASAGVDKTICIGGTGSIIGMTAVAGISYAWTPTTGLSSSTVSNPTANPTATTTYTLTATNTTTGCVNSDQILVTVNPQPSANAGVDKTICNGSSTTIGTTGVAGNTYTWSPTTALGTPYADITTATPTSTTTYTVTAKVTATGCTKTDQVIVTVNPKPTANAGLDKTITTAGGSVTIGTTGVAGNTYSWTPSLGLNNPTLAVPTASPTSTTTYTLTVTNSTTGCTNTDQVVVTVTAVKPASEGNNHLTQRQFNVFPNPVENVLNITSDDILTGEYEVIIRNTAGQEIVRKVVKANEERMNLQLNMIDLSQGVYILNIQSTDGNSVHKLIKE